MNDQKSPNGTLAEDELAAVDIMPAIPSKMRNLKGSLIFITLNALNLVIAFWMVASWLYGVFFNTTNHAHQLTVLATNFDQGPVGDAFLQSISMINGQPNSPNYVILDPTTTTPEEINQKVFDGKVWGAIYTAPNASILFEETLNSDEAAALYNPANAIHYSGLEVRYATVWQGIVLSNFLKVIGRTQVIFNQMVISPLYSTRERALSPEQLRAIINPIQSTFHNLAPFALSIRFMVNTIGFVFPTLLIFFFVFGMVNVLAQTGVFRILDFKKAFILIQTCGVVWPLVAGLCVISWILIFRENYEVRAKDFFALWAVFWVFEMIMFDLIYTIVVFVPLPFVPVIVVMITILTVASVAYPIEIAYRFYRIHYAIPAYSTWETMITIFGRGAANKLHYNLPILASWFVVGKLLSFIALRRSVSNFYERPKSPEA